MNTGDMRPIGALAWSWPVQARWLPNQESVRIAVDVKGTSMARRQGSTRRHGRSPRGISNEFAAFDQWQQLQMKCRVAGQLYRLHRACPEDPAVRKALCLVTLSLCTYQDFIGERIMPYVIEMAEVRSNSPRSPKGIVLPALKQPRPRDVDRFRYAAEIAAVLQMWRPFARSF